MEQDLESVTDDTVVIPTELQSFIKTLELIPEVIQYISSEIFNPEQYYLAQGMDLLDAEID